MWLAIQGRIQTGAALKQKKWKGDENHSLCNSLESVYHVLFQCVMARFVWASFKEALGWDRAPNSLTDLFDHWIILGCKDYELRLFHFVIVAWGFGWLGTKLEYKTGSLDHQSLSFIRYNSFCRNGQCCCGDLNGRSWCRYTQPWSGGWKIMKSQGLPTLKTGCSSVFLLSLFCTWLEAFV